MQEKGTMNPRFVKIYFEAACLSFEDIFVKTKKGGANFDLLPTKIILYKHEATILLRQVCISACPYQVFQHNLLAPNH
jgi:hypothetical protein